jgi:hypothetical protein
VHSSVHSEFTVAIESVENVEPPSSVETNVASVA